MASNAAFAFRVWKWSGDYSGCKTDCVCNEIMCSFHKHDSYLACVYILSCVHLFFCPCVNSHFLWSGTVTIVSTLISWREIGAIAKALKKDESSTATRRKIDGQRRRLLQISLQTCLCLILNVAATVGISGTLDEWGRSSNLWLQCTLFETWRNRDWDAYGFSDGCVVEMHVWRLLQLPLNC